MQHFADLVTDRGARAAWTRTGVDLIVTIPRYRLENIMTEQHSATILHLAITLLAAGGVLSLLTGLGPGLALLLAAVVLAVSQRSTLAHAIRTPDTNRRRRRLALRRSWPSFSWPPIPPTSSSSATPGRSGRPCWSPSGPPP